jgi:hypothetical protein
MLDKFGRKRRLSEIKRRPAIQGEAFAQSANGALSVLCQRAGLFRLADDPGGEVAKANSRFDLVATLAAGPACPITFLAALFEQSGGFKPKPRIALSL